MRAFVFKLYSSKRNKRLHQQIDVASAIWNHCIALHKRYYRMYGKHLGSARLQLHITKCKRREPYAFWNQLGSQAIQDVAQRIDKGYKKFFDYIKGKKSGKKGLRRVSPPAFRKRIKYKSFALKQAGYKLLDGSKVRIGDKTYRYFKSREIEGKIKTLTIKRDPLGDIYLCFAVDVQPEPANRIVTGKMAGVDFGLKQFLTLSDGSKVEHLEPLKRSLKKLKKVSRSLSRKVKGSRNQRKASLELARLHCRIKNQRADFHWQEARKLCLQYDALCLEGLCLKGMKALWGRKVSDLGFGSFVRILECQAKKLATTLIFGDRFYASSKTCSVCEYLYSDLQMKDRRACPQCSASHDRDVNAAVNLLRVGASTLGLGDVRPVAIQAVAV